MASMCFGFKSINKTTGEEYHSRPVGHAACWAPLKWADEQRVLSELTWVPENGESNHVKVLLPLMFPDIKYEEIKSPREAGGKGKHYAVRFTGLQDVYRNNFMFRMFVIRNIDRDLGCTRTFEYLLKAGYDPLMSAAVAANTDVSAGWNGAPSLNRKGYACCFSASITVADVKAFARNPGKYRTKRDTLFGAGQGFGYGPRQTDGRYGYDGAAVQAAIQIYKPTNPAFRSKLWNIGVQDFLVALFKDKKLSSPDLAQVIFNIKVVN